jgi:hypothetical protein
MRAEARFNGATRQWSTQIDALGLHFEPRTGQPFDIHFKGEGDRNKVAISEFNVTQGDRKIIAKGELSLADRSLRAVHVSAQWPVGGQSPATKAAPGTPGRWDGQVDILGRVQPMDLKIKGMLTGTNVPLGKQMVRQVDIAVQAEANTDRVTIATEPFVLLDGQWQINGQHEWSNTLTQLNVMLDGLSLESAATMAGSPLVCQGRAKAKLQLTTPGIHLRDAVASGSWNAEAVRIPPFSAESAHGKIRIADGLVRFDEIHFEQGQGQAVGHMQFRLDRPQYLSLAFKTTAWPIQFDGQALEFRLDGTADAQLDVLNKTMNGEGRLSGDVMWEKRELGPMTLATSVQERTLTVREFRAEALGGVMEATAEIPLDQWTSGTGRLQWSGIEPNALGRWWPQASRVTGQLSGSLTAGKVEAEERAPEPLRLDLHTEMSEGRIGPAELRDGRIVAYLGPRRLLIDQATFHLLGGEIGGRARISPHAGMHYATVVMDVNDIDLNQLVHVMQPQAAQTPGRIEGQGNLLFSSDFRSFSGQTDLTLDKSDLANNAIVRMLYDAMSLNVGPSEPQGSGRVRIQLDGFQLSIPSFAYFNRGVEIRGAGRINDIRQGSASPIEGHAYGSTRVLKGIGLPGIKELDRLMSSIQSNAASVKIAGDLGQPDARIVPLPAISAPLRRLLWVQLRGNQYKRPDE